MKKTLVVAMVLLALTNTVFAKAAKKKAKKAPSFKVGVIILVMKTKVTQKLT